MDQPNRILVIAKPGNFRESLAAVLKTLPQPELFLLNGIELVNEKFDLQDLPNLVLADLDGCDVEGTGFIELIKERWPGIRCVFLVDNKIHTKEASRIGADYVLPRSTSTGELLSTVQQLIGVNHPTTRTMQAHQVITMV